MCLKDVATTELGLKQKFLKDVATTELGLKQDVPEICGDHRTGSEAGCA
jgi:hypothetical protein